MSGCAHVENAEPAFARITVNGIDAASGEPFVAERVECFACAMRTLEEFDRRVRPGGVIEMHLQPEPPCEEPKPPGYTCPRCGRTSYHPKDVEHSYCGACHVFEHG